jgi:sugar phosphate isomerase/epimerase
MLKFGMPAMIELDTLEQTAALCGELGLDFVELNTNFPQQQVHLMDCAALRELAEKYGIFYTIHLNDEMPVADFNPLVAEGYRKAVLETIEFAKKLGIQVLNMHISEGAHFTTPGRIIYFYEAYREDYLKGIAAFRDACEEAIGDSGIHICMENSKAYFDFQKEALDVLLESPAFALTLDIGHSHCSGYADENWIRERSGRLMHMHMHDAKGAKQDHQPLGRGEMDIPGYLALAEKTGCTVLLEVKTVEGLRGSVRWIRERGL